VVRVARGGSASNTVMLLFWLVWYSVHSGFGMGCLG